MDLGYFARGLLGSWPQADAGVVLWSLSVCANDWQSAEKLICTGEHYFYRKAELFDRLLAFDVEVDLSEPSAGLSFLSERWK